MGLLDRLRTDRAYSVKAASALLAVTALFSNVLGLVRNTLFFGIIPADQLDIYFASFRIPDFLFNFIILGAATTAFVPLATALISQDKEEEAWQLTSQLLSWLTLIFVVIGVLLAIFMTPIMRLVVPGFDPERFALAVQLSRLMLLQPLFFAWSFTVGSVLNSSRRFTTYALAPLVYNLALIIGGILAAKYGIRALTYTVIVGAFCHLWIQLAELRRTGFRFRWALQWNARLKEIFTVMIPRSISQGMGQLVLIAYTALGSYLLIGSIAVFNGLNDLQTTPNVIIVNSLAIAIFPALSTNIAKQEWEEMNAVLSKALRISLFLLLPTLALGFILRAQLIRLYLGLGGLSWTQTDVAIDTFVWFLVGIIPAAIVILLSRVFFAFRNTLTPMYISVVAGLSSIAVAYVGIVRLHGSVAVLALAAAVLSIVQAVLYLLTLYSHEHVRLELGKIFLKALSYFFGSVLAAGSAWATLHFISYVYTATNYLGTYHVIGLFIQLLAAGTVGALVYLGYSMGIHREELQWLRKKRFTNSR